MKKILLSLTIFSLGILLPMVSFATQAPTIGCSADDIGGITYIGSNGEKQVVWTATVSGIEDLSDYEFVWTDNTHLGTTYPSSNTMTNTYTSSELGEQSISVEIGNGENSYTATCSTDVELRTFSSLSEGITFSCGAVPSVLYVGSLTENVTWTTNFDSLDLANPDSYEFVWTDNAHLGTTYSNSKEITNSYDSSNIGIQEMKVEIGNGDGEILSHVCSVEVKERTISSLSEGTTFSCNATPSTIYVGSSTKDVVWTTNFDSLDLANPDSYEFVWIDNAYLSTQYGDVRTITNSYDNTKLGLQTVKVEIGNGDRVLSTKECSVDVAQEKTASYVTPGDFTCWAEPTSVSVDSKTSVNVVWKTNFDTLGLTDGGYEFVWTDNAHLGTTYSDTDSITNTYDFSEIGNQTVTVNVGNGGDTELVANCSVNVTEKRTSSGGGSTGGGSVGNTCKLIGNVDGDDACDADILDFNLLMLNWGSTVSGNDADLNNDGRVDILDLNILMLNWTGTL